MIPTTHLPPAGRPSDDGKREEFAENIRHYGVQLIAVYDSRGDCRPYIHTIGLHERGRPELIAFADTEDDLDYLADLFQQLAREGQPVESGEILPCHTGTLVAADPDPEFDAFLQEHCLTEAREYYGLDHIEVLVTACEDELESTGVH
jgi:hypothetical protein